MESENDVLIRQAIDATKNARTVAEERNDWEFMGYVGSALMTENDNIYTGINIALLCGIGFCAEHSAIAEMVKNGETKIKKIVACTTEGNILPPCGRCREMIYQIDENNLDTDVITSNEASQKLSMLLPNNWQTVFDKPLF